MPNSKLFISEEPINNKTSSNSAEGKVIECTWYLMNKEKDLNEFEFADSLDFTESEDFYENLIIEKSETYFLFKESLENLYIGILDSSNNVEWQIKASYIDKKNVYNLTPYESQWSELNFDLPNELQIIRYLSIEEQYFEPDAILNIDEKDDSINNLSLTVTNSLDYTRLTNKENLIGMTWKNKQIPFIGDGNGDGGYCHWNFYRKQGSSIKEFML